MTLRELESRLEAGRETPSFEVKTSMSWDVVKLAKDILALSNVPDGGYIVIGVENESFRRVGIDTAVKSTYNEEVMRDQMASFAEPHADFSLSFLSDTDGKEFAVIRIEPFKQLPVICAKDSAETVAGTIYYRTSRGRVKSAPVSNAYDMNQIILLALARTSQGYRDLGIEMGREKSIMEKYLDELDGL